MKCYNILGPAMTSPESSDKSRASWEHHRPFDHTALMLKFKNKQLAAWATVMLQCAALQVSMSIGLVDHLLRVCVSSLASDQCELWHLQRRSGQSDKLQRSIAKTEAKRLKNIAGLEKTDPDLVIYHESGCCPWTASGFSKL